MASVPSPLHHAVDRLDEGEVVSLIEEGANINAADDKNQTALHWAAERSASRFVSILLSNGAKYDLRDHKNRTPLECAVLSKSLGFDNVTQVFIDHGARCDPAILVAIARHNLDAAIDSAAHLIRLGADVNAVDMAGQTILHYIAQDLPEEMMETLFKLGSNINPVKKEGKEENTAHKFLFQSWTNRITDTLITFGANINAVDKEGKTVLNYALQAMSKKKAEKLDRLETLDNPPLAAASEFWKETGYSMLLRYGANLPTNSEPANSTSVQGSTSADAFEVNNDPTVPPGHWPRRLLHIPSMKSLEWRNNNWYGLDDDPRYHAPEYCTLSYTWGRFKLRKGEMPEVQPVNIGGIKDWSLPRINPSHFSLDSFERVINTVRNNGAEFLWVDVACIDQRRGSYDGALEIGRQANIFKGAKKNYIWLSTLSSEGWMRLLEEYATIKPTPQHVLEFLGTLQGILKDPWFSSLWTLQEAFLCKRSHILDGMGLVMPAWTNEPSFWMLLSICENLAMLLTAIQAYARDNERIKAGIQSLNASGLLTIGKRYPIALYYASAHRTATKNTDYVYGIQQIFDLRLGNTAPYSEKEEYSLGELEDQLGIFLLRKYPVESQMHFFASSEPGVNCWHINRFARVPQGPHFDHHFKFDRPHDCFCELFPNIKDGRIVAKFSGEICLASQLIQSELKHRIDVALDRGVAQSYTAHVDPLGDWEQLCKKLQCNTDDIVVLLLGKISSGCGGGDDYHQYSDSDDEPYSYCGLILEMQGCNYWKRLGICAWTPELYEFNHRDIAWWWEEGFFG